MLQAPAANYQWIDHICCQKIHALHEALSTASISCGNCTLPDEKLALFGAYAEGISIADLEEEITRFKDGNTVRNRILHFISQRTERNETFPLVGHVTRIGSSWDGTKVGRLDEVDTLYVLNKGQVAIIPGEHGEVDVERFRVEWNGSTYTARGLNELFANELDRALRNEPPEGMEHSGYAAPRYSGIRVSGPAVTVLFRTATDVGLMEKGSMVSLDITLALPLSYLQADQQVKAIAVDIEKWFERYIIATNDAPIDAVEPHVIPCHVQRKWKPTSAHIESNALHELRKECALKRAHTLLKCLIRKVGKFNLEHRLFQVESDENEVHSTLINMIEAIAVDMDIYDTDQVNRCMRYGYILLSSGERDRYSELKKKQISINVAAAKQIIFHEAEIEDFTPGCIGGSRALILIGKVLNEISKGKTSYITNCISQFFPPICKLSVREIPTRNIDELARNLLCQYDILRSAISEIVSPGISSDKKYNYIKSINKRNKGRGGRLGQLPDMKKLGLCL